MFHVTGQTKLYKVRIGGLLEVDFNNKMKVDDSLGTLKVIRVKHVFDELGHYHNEFDAVPSKFDRIPSPDIDFPIAHAIPAIVTGNEDPDGLGKVQVKFDFDKGYCEYWMPLMLPEAGGPSNRGYIFVPEKNDKVLVSFFEGNPEFPFIMGSMFHGKNGKGIGGGAGNHTKSMRDKSGTEVVLNDKDGSAKIFSPKGNSTVFLDGKGNVSITTPNTITLTAADIKINASNSFIVQSVPGENGGIGKIEMLAKDVVVVNSQDADINLTAEKSNITLASDKGEFGVSSKKTVMSSKGDSKLSSGGVYKITGASNVEINK
jgi:uncharacterized protein involved in type VI secretion and phage assembly